MVKFVPNQMLNKSWVFYKVWRFTVWGIDWF